MQQLKRILVPVDFSHGSRVAFEYAAFLARPFAAQLDVLHIWEIPHYVGVELMLQVPNVGSQPLEHFVRSQAEKEMGTFMRSLLPHDDLVVRPRIEPGDPYTTVLRLATDDRYDMIVMGTHGRTGLSHLLLGSVAEKIVRRAPCAVVTVRQANWLG